MVPLYKWVRLSCGPFLYTLCASSFTFGYVRRSEMNCICSLKRLHVAIMVIALLGCSNSYDWTHMDYGLECAFFSWLLRKYLCS